LSDPQSILDLRRHLEELSKWQGPASKEALSLAQAMEKATNFFILYEESKTTYGTKQDVTSNCGGKGKNIP
jgi:hypothetical protein